MDALIQFFLDPYQEAKTINIVLEFVAALFGVISVFYAKKENILVFPTGIISTGIYVYLLSQWSLYGDLIINIYYTLMSIYGWYMWSKIIDENAHHIPITRSSKWDKLKAFGIFVFTSIFVIAVYRFYNVLLPFEGGVVFILGLYCFSFSYGCFAPVFFRNTFVLFVLVI